VSALYLRELRASSRRVRNSTPDLFSNRRFRILGIQRALSKLGATAICDLEVLTSSELEQMRRDIAAQFSSRQTQPMKEELLLARPI
jgi:hypothetical protein